MVGFPVDSFNKCHQTCDIATLSHVLKKSPRYSSSKALVLGERGMPKSEPVDYLSSVHVINLFD